MSSGIDWRIPPSMPRWLAEVPADRPVVLLLRHSVRDYLPPGDAGYVLPINAVGTQLGQELGRMLQGRLRTLHTSPLVRCRQTAEVLRESANASLPIVADPLLGDPGVYVVDGHRAWANWEALGHEGVMAHLVSAEDALVGMARPDAAARYLVHHMLATAGEVPGLHIFVTHDSLVTATAARLLDRPLGVDAWPWYLEGAFFWRDQTGLHAAYQNEHRAAITEPLCGFEETDVLEFARREIVRTVGPDCKARFFLAGGAFKTLLTGRPPRDIDLWAASTEDRACLIQQLVQRGGVPLSARPFSEAFEIAGRVVEVPHKVEPSTLEERLGHFDLALSAVGVEHRPADHWRVCIHPLARRSVQLRKVLLLKPLANWKYALTTLERMRRYAAELDFICPIDEEAEVWRVFEAQPPDMRARMLDRFGQTCFGGFDVREGALARCGLSLDRHLVGWQAVSQAEC
jgi:broad specificity phosphatase PhoE